MRKSESRTFSLLNYLNTEQNFYFCLTKTSKSRSGHFQGKDKFLLMHLKNNVGKVSFAWDSVFPDAVCLQGT